MILSNFIKTKNATLAALFLAWALLTSLLIYKLTSLSSSEVWEAGKGLRQQIENIETGKDRVVALVNGRPLYYSDIAGVLAATKKNGKPMSEREAIELKIEEELLYQEAEKRDLVPSLEETKLELKKVIEKAKENRQDYQTLQDYLGGLGLSEEKYLENPIILKKYQKFLAVTKLGETLFKDKEPINPSEFEAARQELIENLKKKAEIKILEK